MPRIDHHKYSYRPATITKLELFQNYLREWLPVFLKSSCYKEANIVDFFAGPGTDDLGQYGSPLRILQTVKEFYDDSSLKKDFEEKRLNVFFNELDQGKYSSLKLSIEDFRNQNELSDCINIQIENKKFEDFFPEINSRIKSQFNLYFIDQSGLQHANSQILSELFKNRYTDFLLFLAASAANRFKDDAQKLLDLDSKTIKELEAKDDFYKVHEILTDDIRRKAQLISPELHIIPFSLKQEANLYGVIFGSHNILGADKFLSSAWSISIDGSSNFGEDTIRKMKEKKLNREKMTEQLSLFSSNSIIDESAELMKKDIFLAKINQLESKIKDHLGIFPKTDNHKIYKLTIESGFLPKHANELLLGLKNDCNLEFMKEAKQTRSPGIGYKQTKDGPTVEIIKHG